ncbi:hypothetical protein DICVIV_05884 [Dictyocaulus viviparus]|uniref:Uncharacterized protein n=1 Tax=Dictyocaulus viviparus TaxID=29172 RepID=A0A0D8XW82_DICVI|nr:hypothetical protein DICVIV_05884 [Dictyocaulus viviparus]
MFAQNVVSGSSGRCLVYTNYAFDVGLIRISTLERMKLNPLPAFEKSKHSTSFSVTSLATTTTPQSTTRIWHPRTRAFTSTPKTPNPRTVDFISTTKAYTLRNDEINADSKKLITTTLEDLSTSDALNGRDQEKSSELPVSEDEGSGSMSSINPRKNTPFPNISLVSDLKKSTPNCSYITRYRRSTISLLFCMISLLLY